MKICLVREYTPPAAGPMGAERVVENLCRGLLKLGHEVVLKCDVDKVENFDIPIVSEIPNDCDLIHFHGWYLDNRLLSLNKNNIPWVCTIHGGGEEQDVTWLQSVQENVNHMIFVSKFVADRFNHHAYVWTCTNPEDMIYREVKENYFFWCAGTDWGEGKGLFTTINLAKKLNFKLKVAGTGKNQEIIKQIKMLCDNNVEYIGSVNGLHKAELFAKAKGFFLLTKLQDACPTVCGESMLSGTPIIGSAFGAVPELINEKVGFVCRSEQDIVKSIMNINKIKSEDCRDYGIANFSNLESAKKHLEYYNSMLQYGKV